MPLPIRYNHPLRSVPAPCWIAIPGLSSKHIHWSLEKYGENCPVSCPDSRIWNPQRFAVGCIYHIPYWTNMAVKTSLLVEESCLFILVLSPRICMDLQQKQAWKWIAWPGFPTSVLFALLIFMSMCSSLIFKPRAACTNWLQQPATKLHAARP